MGSDFAMYEYEAAYLSRISVGFVVKQFCKVCSVEL